MHGRVFLARMHFHIQRRPQGAQKDRVIGMGWAGPVCADYKPTSAPS
jgi:hypothetical protein